MKGPQHYAEAERLLSLARSMEDEGPFLTIAAEAQVHATLALAAAIIDVHDNSAQVRDWEGSAIALVRYASRWEGDEDGEEITTPASDWARAFEGEL